MACALELAKPFRFRDQKKQSMTTTVELARVTIAAMAAGVADIVCEDVMASEF